jgi:NifB/MoaA-like Fe-S oxidoreductase
VNDGAVLERSISELATLWPAVQTVSIVPVGLTKHHKYGMRPHTAQEAAEMLDYLEAVQGNFQERFNTRFVYPTDEWFLVANRPVPPLQAYDGQQLHENGLGLVRQFLDEYAALKYEIGHEVDVGLIFKEVTLVTGTLFSSVLQPAADGFADLAGCQTRVIPVVNQRLGETITAAGLLMAGDIVAQLRERETGDLVVLPRVVFDHPQLISLDNFGPQQVADELAKPVALADVMGDVWDACTGRSKVVYYPSNVKPC